MSLSTHASYAVGLIVLAIAAAAPLLLPHGFLLYMLSLSMIGAIIATGLNITNGYLGILNLSVGGQVALGSYVCALLALAGVAVPVAIVLAAIAGALLAALTFMFLGRLTGFFFGLATIAVSLNHLDGHEMVKFMTWAQGILTLQPGVYALVADAHPIFKAHLFLGMTIFLLFPFTRLVHVWSAPIWYLGRRGYQVVRTRRIVPAE